MKLLTITVPCYNSQEYMEKCLNSLLSEKERIEIIIIDDGSTDDTGKIADHYAQMYPDTVSVIHQENGGHGEGINQGLKHASGIYFKVVDSDDTLSEDFSLFLDTLEDVENHGGVDLFVTNYYYVHADGKGDRSINYSNALPEKEIFLWNKIRRFKLHQLLTIHSCTFRTELMRKTNVTLPKHLFYEDNYMICGNLRDVKTMYYLNKDLYLYNIGRADQSVQESVMKKRYKHQLAVAEYCFKSIRLDDIQDKKKLQYLKHEMFMMFAIGIVFTRLNKSDETDADIKTMWDNCREYDPKWTDYFQKKTALALIDIPGKAGMAFTNWVYHTANKIVRFN